MDDLYTCDRRSFLRTGTVAAAAGVVGCGAGSRWRALTDAQAATLAAACNRVVPPDDFPGAVEAGVVEFIDRQLATREGDRLDDWTRGLAGLDALAVERHQHPFAELSAEAQDATLAALEAGGVAGPAWGEVEPRAFFERLLLFSMMGFYGDPRHGGNRDHVGWRLLGVPPAPVRGRLPDESPDGSA